MRLAPRPRCRQATIGKLTKTQLPFMLVNIVEIAVVFDIAVSKIPSLSTT